ncbi:MAG TPA: DNA polymerase III subunit delta [Crinalium sp.]|jgi:DNA polymerase-3 subunit delta
MPIYLYWGEDDFAISRAVVALRDRILDPDWASFNFDKISPEQPEGVTQALNQVMTPPFGMGSRLVWLVDTTICQRCSDDLLTELERTLPVIPDTTVLLLTTPSKPDGRIKSTKLLQKHAEIQEFSLIPPWKTDQLVQQVRQTAQTVGVKLTNTAVQMLTEAVGNDTRQLFSELEKLRLYADSVKQPLGEEAIATLVTTSTQSSLQLAAAIRQGETGKALTLIFDLFRRNEPALKIIKTLTGQFRTWLWVKLMIESGERDEREIARAAEVSNPKRIYFLQQEVKSISLAQLQQAFVILMEIEVGLKQGAEELGLFQTKIVELCQLLQKS